MKRAHLINILKLLFVVGLMTLVAWNIQWRDTMVVTPPGDDVEAVETTGKIEGPWDVDPIRFRPGGSAQELVIHQGKQDNGNDVHVSPGFLRYWTNIEPAYFALAALCYLLTVFFAATRWWWLLRVNNLKVTYPQALRFSWIGVFFNNVVPGQTGGDLVRAIYVMRHCHGQRVPAILSVIVDRVMGLFSLTILAAGAVLFFLDRSEFVRLAIGIWAVLLAVILVGVVAFSRRVRRIVRLKVLLEKLPERFGTLLQRVDEAVFFYRSHKTGMAFWMITGIANHAVGVTSWYFMAEALGVGMPFGDFLVLIPVILIISSVPIAPNGWGVGEALFGYLFRTCGAGYLTAAGIPAAQAATQMATRGVALSVAFRIHVTLLSLIGGVVFFLGRDRVHLSDVQEEVGRDEEEEPQLTEEQRRAVSSAE